MHVCGQVCVCVYMHVCRIEDEGGLEHKQERGNMISLLCAGPVTAVRQSTGLL